ncbi:MAG: hypothetical protein NXI24_03040 [bacterium]|nr:hypothetical protein [bacterium]
MKKFRDEIALYIGTDLNSDQMRKIMGDFDGRFDPHSESGFERGLDMPRPVLAETIVRYLKDDWRLLDFLSHLLGEEDSNTGSGGVVKLRHKDRLFRVLRARSYVYDGERRRFIKDQQHEKTPDWGFLREGDSENFTFLSVDMVDSSSLGEENAANRINHTLFNYKEFVRNFVEGEDGRVWSWDGDGGLAAFIGTDSTKQAMLAARGVLAYLPHFNASGNKLGNGEFLSLRLAVHYGYCSFSLDRKQLNSRDVNEVERLQKEVARSDELALSDEAYRRLGAEKRHLFQSAEERLGEKVYTYAPGRS